MSLSAEQRRRVAELAEELRTILGSCMDLDGRAKRFAELEDECIEASDLLASAVLQLRVSERSGAEGSPCCPSCGREPTPLEEDEVRVLQVDRGEVAWKETGYECRHCRRCFFPSDG